MSGVFQITRTSNGQTGSAPIAPPPSPTTYNYVPTVVLNETPIGPINGMNSLFTAINVFVQESVEVFLNGMKMKRYFDFTIPTNKSILLYFPPHQNETIALNYETNTDLSTYVYNEIPSGNGVVFTSINPFIPETVDVYVNGLKQKVINDFNTTGNNTIILTYPLIPTIETLSLNYKKL